MRRITNDRRRDRKGGALVLALILVVILSATAAAALSMVSSERREIEDQQAAAEAHAMARSAYNQFIADPDAMMVSFTPTTFVGPDSVQVNYSDGYAWVMVQRIRPSISGSSTLFIVRSRAVRTSNRPGRVPVAERTFAQYAQWQAGSMNAPAAWTALGGLLKNGASGTLSGFDNCGATAGVAGVAVPTTPGYQQNGGSSVPTGTPPILDMGTQAQANAMVKVNWSGIVNGTAIAPDITIPGGSWPSFTNPNYWPIIYVNQASTFALPGNGRGLLIVKNDMSISGSRQWNGIVLVGGAFTSNGNNTVSGAIMTGLNALLGQAVGPSDVGNGTKTYRYDSCNIALAAARFAGLAPITNTGADNWSSW